jgi:hypothetical protein
VCTALLEEIDGGRAAITMGGDGSPEAQYAQARALATALDAGVPVRCDWALESVRNASP